MPRRITRLYPPVPYNGYLNPTENILRRFGLNSSYKGFSYVKYAIELVNQTPDILTYVCKGLYMQIAENFNTTINCVERDIRTVIKVIWRSQKQELRIEIFGETHEEKPPCNAAFLDMLAFYIRIKNESKEIRECNLE